MKRSLIQRVRQTIKNAARKLVAFGMVAITAAVLTAPVAQAQQTQTVKFKENNRVEMNGNGFFSYEIKLPVAQYTHLKKNTPNTAVLLRKMGLNTQNMLVENVQGTWDDANSTLRIDYCVKGVARAAKDLTWELPMFEGVETELVAFADGTAVLTQAMNIPGLGVVTSTIRIQLPAGASDVKVMNNPGRLTYKMFISNSTSGTVKGDFEVETKPQLMSALAKAHSNKKFAALHAARSQFKNSGEQTLKDYRVRFRISEYAPTWSSWQGTSVVVPGQTVIDTYFPIFDMEKIGKLTGSTRVAMEIEYQYTTAGGQKVVETETRELTLLSRNQVYYTGMKAEECIDFHDMYQLSEVILGSFTTHEDPVIQQTAGRIANAIGGNGATLSDKEAEKYMKAVYDFMAKNIAYQTSPGGQSHNQFFQHVKYGRDVLKNKAGTCIDLAILFGSLCEAVGLEPVLYVIPGHCFPAVKMPISGKIVPVEATMIGKADFYAANKAAMEENYKPMMAGQLPYMAADIRKLHDQGVQPIDLPNLPDNVLTQWGIEWNFTQTQRPNPVPTPNPSQTEAASKFVGIWTTQIAIQGGSTGTEKIAFRNDGKFMIEVNGNGQTQSSEGTWTWNNGVLTMQFSNGNVLTVRVQFQDASRIVMTFQDGSQNTYTRMG